MISKHLLDEYYACLVHNHTKITFYLVSIYKMGFAEGFAVDSRLKLHSIHSLRVVDEYIMPVIPRGIIIWPTIMIAEKGIEMIIKDDI